METKDDIKLEDGLYLLAKMFEYEPSKRISAKQAMTKCMIVSQTLFTTDICILQWLFDEFGTYFYITIWFVMDYLFYMYEILFFIIRH